MEGISGFNSQQGVSQGQTATSLPNRPSKGPWLWRPSVFQPGVSLRSRCTGSAVGLSYPWPHLNNSFEFDLLGSQILGCALATRLRRIIHGHKLSGVRCGWLRWPAKSTRCLLKTTSVMDASHLGTAMAAVIVQHKLACSSPAYLVLMW